MDNPVAWDSMVVPAQLSTGPWVTAHAWPALAAKVPAEEVVLPICSIGTDPAELASLGPLILPPLFHEALDREMREAIVARVRQCFPYLEGSSRRRQTPGRLAVVDLPVRKQPAPWSRAPGVLAFSVDTAVEEHGPHLPLATDRIQSYAVLQAMAREFPEVALAAPLDYGHLIWALPLGLSVDLPPALVTRYTAAYAYALQTWARPAAMYAVDVHGAPIHRQAVRDGMANSNVRSWKFRWLHEPIAHLAGGRGDTHAGGVETALIQHINPALVDAAWFPARAAELEKNELSFLECLEKSKDLAAFTTWSEATPWNGIVGKISNYFAVDAREMFAAMCATARQDIASLLVG